MKLLFTGGHHNSAVALIDWLKKKNADLEFVWVGRKNTPEYKEVTSRNIKFYSIRAGKLFRTTSIRFIHKVFFNLLLVPVGFLNALLIIYKERPDIVISFGGFIAVPIVIVGKAFGIKSVTHEQTTTIGLANKIIFYFVDKIYVSWPINMYPRKYRTKMVFTGLPLRNAIFKSESNRFNFKNKKPVVYVTGGKSGSETINRYIIDNLSNILDVSNLIWQIGGKSEYNNTNTIVNLVNKLSSDKQKSIIISDYFGEDEIGSVYKQSSLVISRGGAHTIYELLVLEKPAIVIPIPWASGGEQIKNAKYLESAGLGVVIDQTVVSSKSFFDVYIDVLKNIPKWQIKDESFKVILKGQDILGNEILSFLQE